MRQTIICQKTKWSCAATILFLQIAVGTPSLAADKSNWNPIPLSQPGNSNFVPDQIFSPNFPIEIYDQDLFNRCYAARVKPGIDAKSRDILEASCKRAATPKKCRDISQLDHAPLLACEKECKEANVYSRNFGECRASESP